VMNNCSQVAETTAASVTFQAEALVAKAADTGVLVEIACTIHKSLGRPLTVSLVHIGRTLGES
jgi:hypothetical protein